MPAQSIYRGSAPDAGDGDNLYVAGGKMNGAPGALAALPGTGWYNPHSYAIPGQDIGDGSLDALAAITACLADAPAGSTIFFPAPTVKYRITDNIPITKANITILGMWGTEISQATATKNLFLITASGCRIGGLKLTNQAGSSLDRNGATIRAVGTVGTYLSGLLFEGMDLTGGNYGILTQYCDHVVTRKNWIKSTWYGAILGESTNDFEHDGNIIEDVTGTPNAYGISATRTAGVSLAAAPTSVRGRIHHNYIARALNWEGIDCHDADDIDIDHNRVTDCKWGIAVGSDSDNNPPYRGRILSNYVRAGAATPAAGIIVSGNVVNQSLDCTIDDNTVDGYGDGGSDPGAAIRVQYSDNPIVTRNTIRNSIAGAIAFEGTCTNIDCAFNTVRGFTAAGAFSAAIKIPSGATVTGAIRHNDIDNVSGTHGIRAAAAQGVWQYGNRINTTGYSVLLPEYFYGRAQVEGVQIVTTSPALNPDLDKYTEFQITLNGNIAIGAPAGRAHSGMRIRFMFIQDATGGRTVTMNAIYKKTWSDTGNTAGKVTTKSFLCQGDGAAWIEEPAGVVNAYL
jgi:hypothetical protein